MNDVGGKSRDQKDINGSDKKGMEENELSSCALEEGITVVVCMVELNVRQIQRNRLKICLQ